MKSPRAYVPPIRMEDESWARCEQDKADMYPHHLERVFQPNEVASELDIAQCQPLSETCNKTKHFTPVEIAKEIDMNINQKKAHGIYTGHLTVQNPRSYFTDSFVKYASSAPGANLGLSSATMMNSCPVRLSVRLLVIYRFTIYNHFSDDDRTPFAGFISRENSLVVINTGPPCSAPLPAVHMLH
ncbi:Hypothetical protein CINCED_3A021192 [Cinara cedri]|uniref:Uncharacterized protein n=1 Tax=Cinara cedri TaxID=506608 RepID=A0A5E4NQK9_9HEMI|nr:Hypothetical protein CINCED_3A021192 [Cinara cedri]